MAERATVILRILVLVLAGVFTLQLVQLLRAPDPLAELNRDLLPDLPRTDAPGGSNSAAASPRRPAALPTDIQKQVEQVTSSEVFGAVPHPLPMAVLGIGGQDAFIRTPAGGTEVMRVGDEAGGVKLLQIGINRVLVEHEGKPKELILYPELGGPSLLPKN
jgi:hypothetical protein